MKIMKPFRNPSLVLLIHSVIKKTIFISQIKKMHVTIQRSCSINSDIFSYQREEKNHSRLTQPLVLPAQDCRPASGSTGTVTSSGP